MTRTRSGAIRKYRSSVLSDHAAVDHQDRRVRAEQVPPFEGRERVVGHVDRFDAPGGRAAKIGRMLSAVAGGRGRLQPAQRVINVRAERLVEPDRHGRPVPLECRPHAGAEPPGPGEPRPPRRRQRVNADGCAAAPPRPSGRRKDGRRAPPPPAGGHSRRRTSPPRRGSATRSRGKKRSALKEPRVNRLLRPPSGAGSVSDGFL